MLPNASSAVIPDEKIRDYVLSRSHPIGRFKAAFISRLGFDADNWSILASELRSLALREEAIRTQRTVYGQKYIVRGIIEGPNGRSTEIETVWIVLFSEDTPRLITAYPGD